MQAHRLLLVLLALSVAGSTAAQAADPASGRFRMTTEQQRLLAIELAPVTRADRLILDGLAGEVQLPVDTSAAVTAPFSGRVTQVLVDEGDTVSAGQIIAYVASREFSEAQARLGKATSARELARAQAERDRALLAEGIIPASRAEASLANLQSLDSEVTASRAALAGIAGGTWEPTIYPLIASVAGQVIERRIAAGEPIEAMQVGFILSSARGLRLEIRVPLADGVSVKVGDVVRVGTTSARVTGRGAAVEPLTQTIKVLATLPADSGLLPGQRVTASLELPAPPEALQIPRSSLSRRNGRTEVYVAEGEQIRVVPVKLLAESQSSATVTGPLMEGDRIIVNGVSAIKAMAIDD